LILSPNTVKISKTDSEYLYGVELHLSGTAPNVECDALFFAGVVAYAQEEEWKDTTITLLLRG